MQRKRCARPNGTIKTEAPMRHKADFTLTWKVMVWLVVLAGIAVAQPSGAPRACRSVHLWWRPETGDPVEGTAFYNEVTVQKSTGGSYFMACGFSKGYFGIQELSRGKKIALFSVWEPGNQDNPNATPEERRVKELAIGDGVRTKRFGGEGTGGQSFYDYEWEIGETVRFVVFAKPHGDDRTQYAGYIYVPGEHRWQHMATFSTLAGGHLLRGCYSFVEDFRRNGESAKIVHQATFGNAWMLANQPTRQDGGQEGDASWQPLTRTRFTADNTPTTNIDSGVEQDRFFLTTGGDTTNDHTKLREESRLDKADRKPPLDLPIPFSKEESATRNTVRVLAYNIKHGRGNDGKVDLERIATVIRRLNPDVVALQEIDNIVRRSGRVDEPKRLSVLTGLPHNAFGSFFDYQGGEYGMAIVSRYPLDDVTNLRLPDGAEPRTSLVATVKAPQPFRLADVHFYRTEAERLAQTKTLLEFLADRTELPCVIAGDFNSRPGSAVLEAYSGWTNPEKGEDHFTFASDNPRSEIYFILLRPGEAFRVHEIDVVHEPVASDHRPVSIDLEFVGNASP